MSMVYEYIYDGIVRSELVSKEELVDDKNEDFVAQ